MTITIRYYDHDGVETECACFNEYHAMRLEDGLIAEGLEHCRIRARSTQAKRAGLKAAQALLNSVEVYVEDAVGGKYCHSCSDLAYEAAAVKHARWWTRQHASRMLACAPFRVVVARYCDPSSGEG